MLTPPMYKPRVALFSRTNEDCCFEMRSIDKEELFRSLFEAVSRGMNLELKLGGHVQM